MYVFTDFEVFLSFKKDCKTLISEKGQQDILISRENVQEMFGICETVICHEQSL